MTGSWLVRRGLPLALALTFVTPCAASADPLRIVAREGQKVGAVRITGFVNDIQAADSGVVAFTATFTNRTSRSLRFQPGAKAFRLIGPAFPGLPPAGVRLFDLADSGDVAYAKPDCDTFILRRGNKGTSKRHGNTCWDNEVIGGGPFPKLTSRTDGDLVLTGGRIFYPGTWFLDVGPTAPADTGARVLRLDPADLTPESFARRIDNMRDMRAGPNGSLLIQDPSTVYRVVPGGDPVPVVGKAAARKLPGANIIESFTPDGNGDLLLCTDGGIFEYTAKTRTVAKVPVSFHPATQFLTCGDAQSVVLRGRLGGLAKTDQLVSIYTRKPEVVAKTGEAVAGTKLTVKTIERVFGTPQSPDGTLAFLARLSNGKFAVLMRREGR